MDITSAQYVISRTSDNDCISVIIDGTPMTLPQDPDNRHYAEIMRQVEAGKLTIQEAD